jgi:hypothetical protein
MFNNSGYRPKTGNAATSKPPSFGSAVRGPSYGFCPKCGAAGQCRERRMNGDDKCASGHTYPSRESLSERPQFSDPVSVLSVAREDAEKFGAGWVRIWPDGKCERIDPMKVYTKDEESSDG